MSDNVVSRLDEPEDIFAIRLKFAREKRNLNQTELAKLASLQPAAIGHFEKNRRKPSFANVRALAKALNISSDYLLGRSASIAGATTAFRGEENLSNADRDHIQMMIDLMSEKNQKRNDE